MSKEKDTSWREDVSVDRFMLIWPILQAAPDSKKMNLIRKSIADEKGISEKTLRRYEAAYNEGGLGALAPDERRCSGPTPLPDNFDELLSQAIELRREVPKRSVAEIIRTLEREGRVAPGVLKRSTLERHMYDAGFGSAHMKQYERAPEGSSKRYTRSNRMMMCQADIKEIRNFPMGPDKKGTTLYLTSIIDVHSRFMLYSVFYPKETADIVEDTIREAILRCGKMDLLYFDHGSQYISGELRRACAELGIMVKYAPVRSGKSKGCIERFHQTVDRFKNDAVLMDVPDFDALNRLWEHYLDAEYLNQPHEGIREYYLQNKGIKLPAEGITPRQEWDRDSRPLTFLDKDTVAHAFLRHQKATIDPGGNIRFNSMKYFGGHIPSGRKVEITFDPRDRSVITVYYEDREPFKSYPIMLGDYVDPTPVVPQYTGRKPKTSRVLEAIEKQYNDTPHYYADALSFADYAQEGGREHEE